MARDPNSAPRQVSPISFRRITLAVLAAQILIVLSGAAVRLTGSGLGCSDWPRCEQDRLVAPLELHPMIEFINRCVSFVVVATVVLAIWGALRRVPYRRDLLDLVWWITAITAAQIVLGGITVRTDLWPPVVMAHFLLSMILIWIAVTLHHRATVATREDPASTSAVSAISARLNVALAWVLAAVLLTGTVVTASGPHGGDAQVERLGFYVPTVARIHAVTALVFLAVLLVTIQAVRTKPGAHRLLRAATITLQAVIVQGAIGYYQYLNGVPELVVFLHVAGSMAVLGTTVWFVLEHRRHEQPDEHPTERASVDGTLDAPTDPLTPPIAP
ncbi:MAG: COX15/CtaA family protein [Acidimicrobiales bacterium]